MFSCSIYTKYNYNTHFRAYKHEREWRRRARDASRRVERGHVLSPMRHQSARNARDVGEVRITAAAPYKGTDPPTGFLSGGRFRQLPGP